MFHWAVLGLSFQKNLVYISCEYPNAMKTYWRSIQSRSRRLAIDFECISTSVCRKNSNGYPCIFEFAQLVERIVNTVSEVGSSRK